MGTPNFRQLHFRRYDNQTMCVWAFDVMALNGADMRPLPLIARKQKLGALLRRHDNGGTQDDYNPIAACKAYVKRLRAAGADVELTEFPNASHAFDNPLGAQPAVMQPQFQSARNCKIQEEADGLLINTDTKQPFTYTDRCVIHGVHIGHDPFATRAAKQAVKDLLKTAFQLP